MMTFYQSDPVTLTVSAAPTVAVGANQTICQNASALSLGGLGGRRRDRRHLDDLGRGHF